jgi:hypothetical protein
MHGGARGSGAPKGERNGMWKHGGYTGEAIALRQAANRLMRGAKDELTLSEYVDTQVMFRFFRPPTRREAKR